MLVHQLGQPIFKMLVQQIGQPTTKLAKSVQTAVLSYVQPNCELRILNYELFKYLKNRKKLE